MKKLTFLLLTVSLIGVPPAAFAQPTPDTMHIQFVRVNVGGVQNFKAAHDWYTQKLGLTDLFPPVFPGGPGYPWVSLAVPGQPRYAIAFGDGPADPSKNYGLMTLSTDDICKEKDRLESAGILLSRPVHLEKWGQASMLSLSVRDPFDQEILFTQFLSGQAKQGQLSQTCFCERN